MKKFALGLIIGAAYGEMEVISYVRKAYPEDPLVKKIDEKIVACKDVWKELFILIRNDIRQNKIDKQFDKITQDF